MDAGDFDDADIRAAIVASLRDLQSPGRTTDTSQQDVVDLTADTDTESEDDDGKPAGLVPMSKSNIGSETDGDDDDLKRAIELSLQDADGEGEEQEEIKQHGDPEIRQVDSAPSAGLEKGPTPLGLLVLDRKQMEQERLARVAKRKAERSISPPSVGRSKLQKSETTQKEDDVSVRPVPGGKQATPLPGSQPPRTPGIVFPQGVVKKTWANGCPRIGDDITIEEVFQRSDLELAVLSSFIWDMDWVFSKLDTSRTRFILMMQAKEEATRQQYLAETAEMRNIRLCFPPMDGQVNCMHSKLMILFHPDYVRLVVPSANLVPFDWGENRGVMENMVFLIDLPKRSGEPASPKTPFYDDLVYFLQATTLNANIIAKLEGFDFGETQNLGFVHTIGGTHTGDSWRRTGYCGLGRAVRSLGLQTSQPLNIDFVASSIGSLTDQFLRSIYRAAQADDSGSDFTELKPKTEDTEWTHRFRIFYPSHETVQASKGGDPSAGTICFQAHWYEGAKFPRHVLRDCISRRPMVLMHNKILFARLDEAVTTKHGPVNAWAYIGSANISESAWGRLVSDRSTKQPKLNCRNWECGVLVPVGKETPARDTQTIDTPADDLVGVFEGTVPVPMVIPGRRFEGGIRPWFQR
ncbi:hypothetical protein ASPZODRAFT_73516 [Penicilliopsis zonata CBS 506.65]|uniref:PLD phosphodiesterase domain-containing protein n=1 Tax=Penicilliopsis zonata CBS 506.65 TaxID=1073090 RepID=A0A1L9S9D7_9EURO|nr:hypothetical protein ASPZODRAFT_73516 [Penicilliopsis zonata CBS 506.65]OJJ43749.1 hypothetical protein ASPZODRAFT_73516 [Penicilliopsis zonata CBS 506.65]